MYQLYYNLVYQPLLNALIFLYENAAFRDLGIAIILLTLLIRLILYPLFQKGAEHQTKMQALQPHIKKIQEQHRNDRQAQGIAMTALFQEHKINPFSGIFLILLQFPVMIAIYQIVYNIFSPQILESLYSFVPRPENLDPRMFGLINLTESNMLFLLVAVATQILQSWISMSAANQGKMTSQQMTTLFIVPVILIIIYYQFQLSNAVLLYLVATSIFSIGQQYFINRKLKDGKLGNVS